MNHVLYTNHDEDRPSGICDRNWHITLSLCKNCGKGESELLNEDGSPSECKPPNPFENPSDAVVPQPNPWHPMNKPVDLKVMGKLLEEVNELGAALARCIIQGVDEREPVTGKLNREWVEDEMADVYANIELASERFGFKIDWKRVERKKRYQTIWHNQA